jgi:hypothetical protein
LQLAVRRMRTIGAALLVVAALAAPASADPLPRVVDGVLQQLPVEPPLPITPLLPDLEIPDPPVPLPLPTPTPVPTPAPPA